MISDKVDDEKSNQHTENAKQESHVQSQLISAFPKQLVESEIPEPDDSEMSIPIPLVIN